VREVAIVPQGKLSGPQSPDVEQELLRVLASGQFTDSRSLSSFLEYVVRKTLAGHAHEVKEYSIGTQALDRPESFDPRLDTIVRVQATKLRARLIEYYATTGATDPVRIELPRGSYVPVFVRKEAFANTVDVVGWPEHPAVPPQRRSNRNVLPWTIAALGTGCALFVGILYAVRALRPPVQPEAIRFTMAPPENGTFLQSPTVSPDGRRVLCTVSAPGGGTALWIRPLAAGSGQLLSGTEGAMSPSWSWDGRYVLFTSEGKLKKVDIGGGAPPQVIPGRAANWGSDWNRDNVILLGQDGAGIARISAAGGGRSTITHLDAAHHETSHYWPRFLPDGQHFLYFARGRDPAENAIYAASLDGKFSKRLLTSESRAEYALAAQNDRSDSGYLLYVRGHTLFAQKFDPNRMELSGDPQPITEDVGQLPYGVATFSVSETGTLVYLADPGGKAQLTWFDRAGKPLGTLGPVGECGDPAISPDGKRVAFDSLDGSNRDIWTVDVVSGNLVRLTFDPEVDHCPVWSPDGSRIVFDSHRKSPGLYVKDANGGGPEALLTSNESLGALDWTRDGRLILFQIDFPASIGGYLWAQPLQGDRKALLYLRNQARELTARISPEGKWIAYTSDESGKDEIFVQSFDGAAPASGGKWQISRGGASQPVWRRDGKELYYLTADSKLMVVSVEPSTVFKPGPPRELFDTHLVVRRGPRNEYDVTRDGQRFLLRIPSHTTAAVPLNVVVNWTAAIKR
jgi:eukaryotic-like serine/threonine-protein kinase